LIILAIAETTQNRSEFIFAELRQQFSVLDTASLSGI
jgi:hypothetical protein